MSVIPLVCAADRAYDADLESVRLQFSVRRKPLPDVFPRIELLDAYARVLKQLPRKLALLGSTSWSKPENAPKGAVGIPAKDARFGKLLGFKLSDDMQSAVIFFQTGKVRRGWCAHTPCGKPFEVRRGRSQFSRWPAHCSTTCRQAAKRVADRKRNAA